MTLHDTPSTQAPTPLAADDPRAILAAAVAVGGEAIGAVRPDQMANATPCDEYDVETLAAHLVFALRSLAAVGRGEDPDPAPAEAAHDLRAAWDSAAHEVQTAWSDDGLLSRIVRTSWAELPGSFALAAYTNEVVVHTWDLARATGQSPTWDPVVLGVAYAAITQGLPAENRMPRSPEARRSLSPEQLAELTPFAEVVSVPDDAPLIDRLVAWNGRQPA